MKNIQTSYGLLLALLVIGCNASTNSQPISKVIPPVEFEEKMKSEDAVILDLRTDKEVAQGIISGAIQMDFYADDFNKKVAELDKDKVYMVYCGSGGRSGKTAKLLSDKGFPEVYDLQGGINAWKAAGKKLEK